MAGRKQHHIPQSLLRQFARETSGKKEQIVVHHRERGIYTPSIDGVAAVRDFYSEPDAEIETLDDKITYYENDELTKLLNQILHSPNRASVDSDAAATFVTHLMVRAAYYRDSVSHFFSTFLEDVESNMGEYTNVWKILELDKPKPGRLLRDMLQEEYQKLPPQQRALPFEIVVSIIYPLVQQNVASSGDLNSISEMFGKVLRNLKQGNEQIIRASHNKGLTQSLAPAPRIETLKKLHWHMLAVQDDALLLPDCIAIAEYNGDRMKPLVFGAPGELLSVQMPIAHNRLLVGYRFAPKQINVDKLNEALARCSWEQFFARRRTPAFESFIPRIREVIQSDMDRAISKAKRHRPAK